MAYATLPYVAAGERARESTSHGHFTAALLRRLRSRGATCGLRQVLSLVQGTVLKASGQVVEVRDLLVREAFLLPATVGRGCGCSGGACQ